MSSRSKSGLTPRQEEFCRQYVIDFNATAAYKKAGYRARSDNSAAAGASELLRNSKIQAYISRLQQQRSQRTEITADRVLQEIAAIAFSDVTDVISFTNGSVAVSDSSRLDKRVTAAIAEVSCTDGEMGSTVKVKLHDKKAALQLAAKHVGLLGDYEGAIATLRLYGVPIKRIGDRLVIEYESDSTAEDEN